jgi:hypothetical protein
MAVLSLVPVLQPGVQVSAAGQSQTLTVLSKTKPLGQGVTCHKRI